MNSGGSRSGRVDRICPSLANVGPELFERGAQALGLPLLADAPSSSGRPNSSFRPCLANTVAIRVPRAMRCGSVSTSAAPLLIDAGPRRAAVAPPVTTVCPSPAVFTMITVQRALWLMRFGTLPEQELLAARHAGVPHDQHVDPVLLRRVDDRHRGVVVDHDVRVPPLPRDLRGVDLQLVGRAAGARRLCCSELGVGRAAGEDHLHDVEVGLVAIRERRRPRDGSLGRHRPVRPHHHAADRTAFACVAVRAHARIIPDGERRGEPGARTHPVVPAPRWPAFPLGRLGNRRRSSSVVEQPPRKW